MKKLNYYLLFFALISSFSVILSNEGKRKNENFSAQEKQEKKHKSNVEKLNKSDNLKRKFSETEKSSAQEANNTEINKLTELFRKLSLYSQIFNNKKRMRDTEGDDSAQQILSDIMRQHPILPFILKQVEIQRDFNQSDHGNKWSAFLVVRMQERFLVTAQGTIIDEKIALERAIENCSTLKINESKQLIWASLKSKNSNESLKAVIIDIAKLHTIAYYLENQLTFEQGRLLNEIYFEAIQQHAQLELDEESKTIFNSLKEEVKIVLAPYIY